MSSKKHLVEPSAQRIFPLGRETQDRACTAYQQRTQVIIAHFERPSHHPVRSTGRWRSVAHTAQLRQSICDGIILDRLRNVNIAAIDQAIHLYQFLLKLTEQNTKRAADPVLAVLEPAGYGLS